MDTTKGADMTATKTGEKILGYEIERTDEPTEPGRIAYLLHGPRGARYALIRSHREPEYLFVWNDRTFRVAQAAGYGWFTDRDGDLVAWS